MGENDVKYADVVSGGDHIISNVRLTGDKNAVIQPSNLMFKK